MKKNIKFALSFLVLIAGLTIAQISLAQPPAPPASGNGGGANTPMGGAAPIDGGLVFLLAGGIGYGARKVYQAKNSRKETK